jgi:hypothetical protein
VVEVVLRMSEYVKQVGGTHYERGVNLENQHWDLMDRFDIEYLVATSSKYIIRWDHKGFPLLDLGKSASYLTKQLLCHPNQGCRRTIPEEFVMLWFADNGLRSDVPREAEKRLLCELVHIDGSPLALRSAITHLNTMLDREAQ